MYDVVIIGAGAAGLSAALYSSRRALKTLVISKDVGGQTATTLGIENYPGVPDAEGPSLMQRFKEQALNFGAELVSDTIVSIKKQAEGFVVVGANAKEYTCRSVILAFGKVPRTLDVPGESEFANKGVVYCATCDAPLFAGKDIVVVGGGSAAIDAVLLASKISNQVYLVHRRDQFRAEDILVERMRKLDNVKIILNSEITKIVGKDFVEEVIVENKQDGSSNKLKVQGVFVEIGYRVVADFLDDLVKTNKAQEIIIDGFNRTSEPGVFAAGDVTTVPFKQTVISAGEGAKAALSAYNYVNDIPVDSPIEDHNRGV